MIHPTSVSPDGLPPCSSGMTATGSHAYFYSLRGAQPQGEGFGRCCIDSPYRPSSGPFGATFPQGKANPRQVGSLLQSPTVHPLRATQAWPTSPYTGEANASPVWRMKFGASGHAAAPTKPRRRCFATFHSSLFTFLFSLKNRSLRFFKYREQFFIFLSAAGLP